jgi:hypothetical protein
MARYMQGLLPAVSVGFVPDFASFDDSEGFPIFRQWSLVEVSLVAAGLDSGAVSQHAPAVTAPLGAPLLIRSPFRSK